jgi:very-short-patch-repair endonuclease
MLWGFVDRDEDQLPEVTVVGAGTRVHLGIRVHRTAELDPRDRRRHQGIPVTSPARTLSDLAARWDGRPLRSAVRRAQGTHRVNVREICEVIARLGPRRGSGRLVKVMAEGPAPTRSVLEDVVLDLILAGGLARPDVNKPMCIDGRRVVPDFRWPQQRLIVEADGGSWHRGSIAECDDAERQALLEAHGERVLRITWAQALTRPTQTLQRLRAAGAPRRQPTVEKPTVWVGKSTVAQPVAPCAARGGDGAGVACEA